MNRCYACYQEISKTGFHESCSKKLFNQATPPSLDTSSEEMEKYAHLFIGNRLTLTGVQRKLSLNLETQNNYRLTVVGVIGGNFILKPPSEEFPELPELEDLCMHLASIAGIEVADHTLIPMKDGQIAYITKRFDRKKNKKIALEDACQLSEMMTEDKYRSSHEKLSRTIKKYSSFTGDDMLRLFELTLFSFITGNADMHLKNFSLLQNQKGHYRLSPAYDLVPTRLLLSENDDPEELALNLNGKKSKFKLDDFLYYGAYMGIPPVSIERTLNRLKQSIPQMQLMIEDSFLSPENKKLFQNLIKARFSRLS